MVFYQKYRAKNFNEMVGQEHVVLTILEGIKANKLVQSYVFSGPRGVGKTSTARLLAKAINCEKMAESKNGEPCNECESCKDISTGRAIDIYELDAASHTGVDDIREIIDKARLAPAKAKMKVYIIDEVHMLSKSAFNALLKTLEEPPKHVVFIMATTEAHKIPATILSRSQRYDFRRATKDEIISNLKKVIKAENIKIDDESLDLIAISAAGGHRDSLGLLEQVASFNGEITLDITRKILGVSDLESVFKLIGAIFNKIPEEGLKIAHQLYEKGIDLSVLNKEIIEQLRRILLFKSTGECLFEDTKDNLEKIKELAALVERDKIVDLINLFIEAGSLLKDVAYPVLPIEMAIINSSKDTVASTRAVKSEKPKNENKDTQINNQETITKKQTTFKPQIPNEAKSIEQSSNETVKESDMVAVPVIQMTRDVWQKIIEAVKLKNATLAALLLDAKPVGLTDEMLTLGVKFKFHKDRISEAGNSETLQKIVRETCGKKCQVNCVLESSLAKEKISAGPIDVEAAVSEIFEVEE